MECDLETANHTGNAMGYRKAGKHKSNEKENGHTKHTVCTWFQKWVTNSINLGEVVVESPSNKREKQKIAEPLGHKTS